MRPRDLFRGLRGVMVGARGMGVTRELGGEERLARVGTGILSMSL